MVVTPDDGPAVRYEFPQVEDLLMLVEPHYRYLPGGKSGILVIPELPILEGAGVTIRFDAKPTEDENENRAIYKVVKA